MLKRVAHSGPVTALARALKGFFSAVLTLPFFLDFLAPASAPAPGAVALVADPGAPVDPTVPALLHAHPPLMAAGCRECQPFRGVAAGG